MQKYYVKIMFESYYYYLREKKKSNFIANLKNITSLLRLV